MVKTESKVSRKKQEKARDEHVQQLADETIAAGEHMDLDAMDADLDAEIAAGSMAPTGYRPPAPSSTQNPNLAEELQGMELRPKVFGPPQYGSPDPASAASRLMTLEDGHPLAGLEEGTAAISEDYGQQGVAAEVDATDSAKELAEEHGVNLAAVEGTGEGGRITKGDVEAVVKASESN